MWFHSDFALNTFLPSPYRIQKYLYREMLTTKVYRKVIQKNKSFESSDLIKKTFLVIRKTLYFQVERESFPKIKMRRWDEDQVFPHEFVGKEEEETFPIFLKSYLLKNLLNIRNRCKSNRKKVIKLPSLLRMIVGKNDDEFPFLFFVMFLGSLVL